MSALFLKSIIVAGGLLMSSAVLADTTVVTSPSPATQGNETGSVAAFNQAKSDEITSIEAIEAAFGSILGPTTGDNEQVISSVVDGDGLALKLTP